MLALVGRPSNRTRVPIISGRPNLRPHPCGFTRTTKQGSKKGWTESRVIKLSRISQGIRVPPLRSAVGRLFHGEKSESRGIATTPKFASADSEGPSLPDCRERLDPADILWLCPTRARLISGQRIVSFSLMASTAYRYDITCSAHSRAYGDSGRLFEVNNPVGYRRFGCPTFRIQSTVVNRRLHSLTRSPKPQ